MFLLNRFRPSETILSDNPKFVLTLVHGTFDRGSKWANPNSEFAQSIKALLSGLVAIYGCSWTGANTQRARRQASAKLKQQLVQQSESHPLAAHFVIAHS